MIPEVTPADARAQVRVRRALAERRAAIDGSAVAFQALHDIRGLLGFDNDGELTPHAQIAGAGSAERYVEQVMADVREYLADRAEGEAEDRAELARRDKTIEDARTLAYEFDSITSQRLLLSVLDRPV